MRKEEHTVSSVWSLPRNFFFFGTKFFLGLSIGVSSACEQPGLIQCPITEAYLQEGGSDSVGVYLRNYKGFFTKLLCIPNLTACGYTTVLSTEIIRKHKAKLCP